MSAENTSIVDAIMWIQHLLIGTFGVIVATLAIGLIGLSLLLGYSSWRQAVRVILGIFVLFGAPAISEGLMQGVGTQVTPGLPQPVDENRPTIPNGNSPTFDPYAGAAIPNSGSTRP